MLVIVLIIVLLAIYIIGNRLWCFWSRSKVCLVGRTAIVTGAVSGLGYQTALALAAKGCRVIIADVANTSQTVERLIKETHNPNIVGKMVDLQSFNSVRAFAEDILATEEKVNILICNAGIGGHGGRRTEDGLEKIMQINYFSHFLLTHLLLDLLKKSSPSRIVFTSSQMAYLSKLIVDTLNPKQEDLSKLTMKLTGGCYGISKLALAAAAKMFGKKLEGTGVTANAVHPGLVQTPIYVNTIKMEPGPLIMLLTVAMLLTGKNVEEGAQTLIHLAQSDEVETITGQSFIEGMKVPRPFQINSDELCQRIWDKSIEYTKLEPHEVKC